MTQDTKEILHELHYKICKERMNWNHLLNMKMDARDEWIEYLIAYYRIVFPDNEYKIYHRWAESQVDKAAESLGDYFSRSQYASN